MPLDDAFMNLLADKYRSSKNGEQDWEKEKESVHEILSQIERDIGTRYDIVKPINIGGTAIIVQVVDRNLQVPQALKCARPIAGKEQLLSRILASEISRLRESPHPNIVSVFFRGEAEALNGTWPYYVMEYIQGARDAQEWVESEKPDYKSIVRLARQCVEGLVFLHGRDTIHGDVKLENILVSPNGTAKISDLGSARLLVPKTEKTTMLTCTRPYAHPELRALISETDATDENRVRASIPRSALRVAFDLYALGKNILRLLKAYDIADIDRLPMYYRSYLDLMACRMLDGYNSDDECALGLPKSALKEIRYLSAEELLLDLRKLTGEYTLHEVISELDHHFPRTVQISSPASSPFPSRVSNFVSQPAVRRLAGVSQLGLIVQIYPTATHSRLEHILGTFFNVSRYCDALWNDPVNPFFRQTISEHDVNLLLLAALCHDIGQYPLAHDLEEAEPKLFSHKEIGENMLMSSSKDGAALRKHMEEEWGVDAREVNDLLSANPTDLDQPLKLRLLHTIIDGPIDADKVDYLVRDSNNLNLTYGNAIDFERLLRCLTIVFRQEDVRTFIALGIHEKGKIPAEGLAFARYAMFGTVYWHHSSRSAKSMLHRAVWEALPSGDRRSKEYQEIKKALLHEISTLSHIQEYTGVQIDLFSEGRTSRLPSTPQLSPADVQMLSWIYERTSKSGKKLLEMLCDRLLFKRLLVVSQRKNPTLWDRLTDLRKNFNWQARLQFQRDVQDRLVRIIDVFDDEKRTTSILSKDVTDEIVGRARRGEVLFTIDIPDERKGSSSELLFLSEARIHGPLTSPQDNVQTEDSFIWTDLSRNFLKSIGKVRVFCHPDIIETCTACLTRNEIENSLRAACDKIAS